MSRAVVDAVQVIFILLFYIEISILVLNSVIIVFFLRLPVTRFGILSDTVAFI